MRISRMICRVDHPVLRALVVAAALSGCGSDQTATAEESLAVSCSANWHGELPADAPSLKVSACAKDGACSSDLVVQIAQDWSSPNCENGQCRGGAAQPPERETALEVRTVVFVREDQPLVEMGVKLVYYPAFAATLADDDRATMTIRTNTDEMMVDAVAMDPYLTEAVPYWDPVATCRNAYLDFSGASVPGSGAMGTP